MRFMFTLILLCGAAIGLGIAAAIRGEFGWFDGIASFLALAFVAQGYATLGRVKGREQSSTSAGK